MPFYELIQIDKVASITELRTRTNVLFDFACEDDEVILIQQHNEPMVVMLSYDSYRELVDQSNAAHNKATSPSNLDNDE